jgi:aspartate ammonia-lyase
MRTEKDILGEVSIPADALYGIHAVRARDNFENQVTFPVDGIYAIAGGGSHYLWTVVQYL